MLWKTPQINPPPDALFHLGPYPFSNTIFAGIIAWFIIFLLFRAGTKGFNSSKMTLVPSGLQNLCEWMVESLYNLVESISGPIKAKKFFPIIATFFIFILVANWLDLIPGVGTIGLYDSNKVHGGLFNGLFVPGNAVPQLVPLIRSSSTDLNMTIVLALISVTLTQIWSFQALGVRAQLGKFFKFKLTRPDMTFVGILELISEFARIIAFAFRLFGNIFAGDVLLTVIAGLVPLIATVPFLVLEVFVGFVQALVFAMLSLIFMEIGTTAEEHEESDHGPQTMETVAVH